MLYPLSYEGKVDSASVPTTALWAVPDEGPS